MKVDEYIAAYFLIFDENVNSIKGLGETIEEYSIVHKILRTLPPRFNSKVSVLEDRANLDKFIKDELHGILTSYEMRTKKDNGSKEEVPFKTIRKPKNNKHECKNSSNICDEEEVNFMRKLKRGHVKYKGEFPFKCFKCGRIKNFSSKCTHEEIKSCESEEEPYYLE